MNSANMFWFENKKYPSQISVYILFLIFCLCVFVIETVADNVVDNLDTWSKFHLLWMSQPISCFLWTYFMIIFECLSFLISLQHSCVDFICLCLHTAGKVIHFILTTCYFLLRKWVALKGSFHTGEINHSIQSNRNNMRSSCIITHTLYFVLVRSSDSFCFVFVINSTTYI